MKFEEILPALREGKKIRNNNWCKDDYIYINSNGEFEDQNGNRPGIFLNCLCDLEADNREIVKEKKKVKLRDLTEKQFEKWREEICEKHDFCKDCPFKCVDCDNMFWMSCKDMYSDKFLDQEIEIED